MNTFTLQPETLASFRQLVDFSISKCSIFQNGDSAGLTETQMQDLIGQQVLDNTGQINAEALGAIQTLATADRFGRIRFAGSGNAFEYINYYSRTTQDYASVTNSNEGLVIEHPVDPAGVIHGISQYMGDSVLRSFEFEMHSDELTAWVLMGAVDLARKGRLELISSNKELQQIHLRAETILEWLQKVPDDAQWFASILKDQLRNKYTLTLGQVQGAVDQLVNRGMLIQNGDGYALANHAVGFGNRFLITENLLALAVGQETDGEVYKSGFIAVQAGTNDILYIDSKEGEVQLEVISSSRLKAYLNTFVTALAEVTIAVEKPKYKIDFVKKPKPAKIEPSEAENSNAFCTKCGASVQFDQKFCHECGTPVQTQKQDETCPSCQSTVDPAMAFCIHCGFKLK